MGKLKYNQINNGRDKMLFLMVLHVILKLPLRVSSFLIIYLEASHCHVIAPGAKRNCRVQIQIIKGSEHAGIV